MKKTGFPRYAVLLLCVLLGTSCASAPAVREGERGRVPGGGAASFTILQMNDVYELNPVSGGREGGLARVAALRKDLLKEDPNTITVLAGDLFSPSALGTARVGGERLAGKQIVAAMNTLGLDYATFGNHEFDIPEKSFLDRLAESRFTWISSNVFDSRNSGFPRVLANKVVEIRGAGGETVRLGIFGLTIDSNKAGYVTYRDVLETAREQAAELRGRVDVLAALTHLPADRDIELAQAVPGIDLILGGHEHENMHFRRGAGYVPISKADANARTVYIHRIRYDTGSGRVEIRSELRRVTGEIPGDPETSATIGRWQELGFAAFRAEGFRPERLVAEIPEPLDGLEADVRNGSTVLTRLLADALLEAVPGAELSLYNAGSIRIDDVLPPGPLTEYDVIRILPFGGKICEAVIEGGMLRKVLERGRANRGQGGYLQGAGAARDGAAWKVNGEAIADGRPYRVAINDFLLSGKEQGLEFLAGNAPGVRSSCREHSDLRVVFGDHLRKRFGGR